jgi:hypothetical protein
VDYAFEAVGDYLAVGGDTADLPEILGCRGFYEQGQLASGDLDGDFGADVALMFGARFPYTGGLLKAVAVLLSGGRPTMVFAGAVRNMEVPLVLLIEDLNRDGLSELVYRIDDCGAGTCSARLHILQYDRERAAFADLTLGPAPPYRHIVSRYPAYVAIERGSDRTQIVADLGVVHSAAAGHQLNHRLTYAWDGSFYSVIDDVITTPRSEWSLIHFVNFADAASEQADFAAAVEAYWHVVNADEHVLSPEEVNLKDYARYRLMVTYARTRDEASAQRIAEVLLDENQQSSGYRAIADTFWSNYEASREVSAACQRVVAFATQDPETFKPLNGFGWANRQYRAEDICPF